MRPDVLLNKDMTTILDFSGHVMIMKQHYYYKDWWGTDSIWFRMEVKVLYTTIYKERIKQLINFHCLDRCLGSLKECLNAVRIVRKVFLATTVFLDPLGQDDGMGEVQKSFHHISKTQFP